MRAMRRSSKSITLVLISATLAAIGFGALKRKQNSSNNPDSYFTENGPSSTQPYSRNDPYYHRYHHYYGTSWWGSDYRSSSGGAGSSGSSSSSHTSRGGFGSSGHAAGS
jgi:hypothetical protein